MSTQNIRKVLIVAFHFPPCAVSSGIQRTLSFVKNLPHHDWHPVVLTVSDGAHERTNPSQLKSIPSEAVVTKAPALDAARHLAIGGRYWSRLTIPDRWRSWWLSAVPIGMNLIRQHNISAIWSTYPIPTAHSIAATLSRLSGLPWIADFRDPMVEYIARTNEISPSNPSLRDARLRVESNAARYARRLVFCTDSARRIVADRYPKLPSDHLEVITNGYDEQAFVEAEKLITPRAAPGRRVLLHSGTIYIGTDRDPTALFGAIKLLAAQGLLNVGNFELRLRNPSAEAYLNKLIDGLGIRDLVTILPGLPYQEALAEMMQSDGLVVLQGYTSNPAVPAKLYEYLRARRPILGLVDPDGETSLTLTKLGFGSQAQLTDTDMIADLLRKWFLRPEELCPTPAAQQNIQAYSRERLTGDLARILREVTAPALQNRT